MRPIRVERICLKGRDDTPRRSHTLLCVVRRTLSAALRGTRQPAAHSRSEIWKIRGFDPRGFIFERHGFPPTKRRPSISRLGASFRVDSCCVNPACRVSGGRVTALPSSVSGSRVNVRAVPCHCPARKWRTANLRAAFRARFARSRASSEDDKTFERVFKTSDGGLKEAKLAYLAEGNPTVTVIAIIINS